MKYGNRPINWFEAIVNKMGGEDAANRFLRGELVISRPHSWSEEDGIIYFSVTSHGITGKQWANRFRTMDKHAKDMILSPDFRPTKGLTLEVAVVKNRRFKTTEDSTTYKIREFAAERKLLAPNPEVACLIRDKLLSIDLTDMHLDKIIVMHGPIKGSDGVSRLLCARRDFNCPLDTVPGGLGVVWYPRCGFAFVVSPEASTLRR